MATFSDTTISWGQRTAPEAEGTGGASVFVFEVKRTGDVSGESRVDYAVDLTYHTASLDDFTGPTSGTVVFAPGETVKLVELGIRTDYLSEPNEDFAIVLSHPQGAQLGLSTEGGWIMNDDGAGRGDAGPDDHAPIIRDEPGDAASVSPNITSLIVNEANLPKGTAPDPAKLTASNSIYISSQDGVHDLTFWDQPVITNGVFTPTTIDTPGGHLTISAFDAATGRLDYSFTLDAAQAHPVGRASINFTYPIDTNRRIVVTDDDGDQSQALVGVKILDDWLRAAFPNPQVNAGETVTGQLTLAGADSPFITTPLPVTRESERGVLTVNADGSYSYAAKPGAPAGDDHFGFYADDAEGAAPPGGAHDVTLTISVHAGPQEIHSPGPGSTVTGTDGADTIYASQGLDVITGGGGADVFAFPSEPWAPITITDFAVGADRLDFSALFQASGYGGADPVGDGYVSLQANGADTLVLFDRDAAGTAQQWPNYILKLEGVASAGLTWAQLVGPASPPPPPPPPGDGPPQLALSTDTNIVHEGAHGTITTQTFTVTRTGDTSGQTLVDYFTWGTATAADFAGPTAGTVYFNPGETTKTIAIAVWGDGLLEDNETFNVVLANARGGDIAQASTDPTVIIDYSSSGPPVSTFNLETTSVVKPEGDEGGTAFTYVIRRSGDLSQNATAYIDVAGVGAHPASADDLSLLDDFAVGFGPGVTERSVTIIVHGDRIPEPDETFEVRLSVGSGSYNRLGPNTVATGTIVNDDPGEFHSPAPGSTVTGTAGADTLYASQGLDVLTGGAGADRFVFPQEPWAPVEITDFQPGSDQLDLRAIFDAIGYAGATPFADGYLFLQSDGAGGSQILVDRDLGGPNPEYPNYIIHLQGVAPGSIAAGDFIVQ